MLRRVDSILQLKVPNIVCKGFFSSFCTLTRKIIENLESCLGVLSLLQKAKGGMLAIGALLLARQGDSVWELEEILEPSCSPRTCSISSPLLGLAGLLPVCISFVNI